MQSILDAILAQYSRPQPMSPMMPTQSPMMAGPRPQQPGMPQQPGPQGPMPQGGPPQPVPEPLKDVENALMSGMSTPESDTLAAFEAGAQPFERDWKQSQERRFGGIAGGIETITDYFKEKRLAPQRDAMNENRARLTQDAAQTQADQKYTDAKTLLSEKYPDASKDEIDALSRRYAMGEDVDIEPEEIEQVSASDMKKIRDEEAARALGMDKDKLSMADTIYDDVKADVAGYNKASMNMDQINSMAERGWKGQGAGQVASLYSMIKALDPDSVVREGEVRLAQMGESLVNTWLAKWEGVTENTIMSEEMFSDVVSLTQEINKLTAQSYGGRLDDAISRGAAHGIAPDKIFGQSFIERYKGGAAAPSEIGRSVKEDKPSERGRDIAERRAADRKREEEADDLLKWNVETGTWE